jgi:hypothetical protein
MQSQTEFQDFKFNPLNFEVFEKFLSKTENPSTSNKNSN